MKIEQFKTLIQRDFEIIDSKLASNQSLQNGDKKTITDSQVLKLYWTYNVDGLSDSNVEALVGKLSRRAQSGSLELEKPAVKNETVSRGKKQSSWTPPAMPSNMSGTLGVLELAVQHPPKLRMDEQPGLKADNRPGKPFPRDQDPLQYILSIAADEKGETHKTSPTRKEYQTAIGSGRVKVKEVPMTPSQQADQVKRAKSEHQAKVAEETALDALNVVQDLCSKNEKSSAIVSIAKVYYWAQKIKAEATQGLGRGSVMVDYAAEAASELASMVGQNQVSNVLKVAPKFRDLLTESNKLRMLHTKTVQGEQIDKQRVKVQGAIDAFAQEVIALPMKNWVAMSEKKILELTKSREKNFSSDQGIVDETPELEAIRRAALFVAMNQPDDFAATHYAVRELMADFSAVSEEVKKELASEKKETAATEVKASKSETSHNSIKQDPESAQLTSQIFRSVQNFGTMVWNALPTAADSGSSPRRDSHSSSDNDTDVSRSSSPSRSASRITPAPVQKAATPSPTKSNAPAANSKQASTENTVLDRFNEIFAEEMAPL